MSNVNQKRRSGKDRERTNKKGKSSINDHDKRNDKHKQSHRFTQYKYRIYNNNNKSTEEPIQFSVSVALSSIRL